MKWLKLLNPLLCLTMLSSLSPLTSCGDNWDGIVTETEWNNAIDYICGYGKELPNFHFGNENDHILYGSNFSDITFDKGSTKCFVQSAKGTKCYSYSTFVSGPIVLETNLEGYYDFTPFYSNASFLFDTFFFYIYDFKNDFSFDKKTKLYSWSGEIESFDTKLTEVNTFIGFNSNKQISYFKTSFKEDGITRGAEIHFDYSYKKVDLPEEFKQKAKTHFVKMSGESQLIDFTPCDDKKFTSMCINFSDIPNDVTKIKPYDGQTEIGLFNSPTLTVKNNELLVEGIDYSRDSKKIEFFEKLKSTDSLFIIFNSIAKRDKSYTIKFIA